MASEAAGDGSSGNVPTSGGKAGCTSTETVNIHIYLLITKITILAASFVKLHNKYVPFFVPHLTKVDNFDVCHPIVLLF